MRIFPAPRWGKHPNPRCTLRVPREVAFPGQAVRAIETREAEIIAHAHKGVIKTGDFPRVSVASDAPKMGLAEKEDSLMKSEKSHDYQGVAVGNEKFRGVGIEPTTKGL